MPAATPGFVGARLREARQVRGLQAAELSEMLGVSPQAVSNYEHDKKSPQPHTADLISQVLNFPAHFFTRPIAERQAGTVFYRSMSAATKTARTRAEWRLRWLEEITEHLGVSVDFPAVNLPEFDVPADPSLLGFDDIEHLAAEARKFWRMTPDGPIGNMVSLLENQGAVVARDRLGAVTLDSLSTLTDRPYVMIGTDKGTCVRWRFDAAHELGHLLLHRRLDRKLLTRATDFKRVEMQAHRFAAAFLLPMTSFADEFFSASLDALRAMKPRWRVSIGMMIRRARDGHLISEEHEQRMQRNYSRRGWRLSEPLDDTLEPENPRLLRGAVELILSHGGQCADDLKQSVALADHDIENLCGLPSNYLQSANAAPVRLRHAPDKPTNVLLFPQQGRRVQS
jgi:Zn-dependent peptidase ImmA (M78 family)/transcriptional regulator with XRE-family HTH domain